MTQNAKELGVVGEEEVEYKTVVINEEEPMLPKPQPWLKYAGIKRRLLIVISIVQMFAVLTSMAYLPVMPTIQAYFEVDEGLVNLTMVSFTLATGFMPLFHGPVCDRFGRKTMLMGTLSAYVGAMIMAGSATSIWLLVLFRGLVGIFSSGLTTYCSGLMADTLNPEERATYMGLTMFPTMILATFVPLVSGFLADVLGWRFGAFYSLAICAIPMVPIIFFLVPETLPRLQILNRASSAEVTEEEWAAAEAPVRPINPLIPLGIVLRWPLLGVVIANAVTFTVGYLANSQFSVIAGANYPFSATVIGLFLVPVGLGRVLGTLIGGKLGDSARALAVERGYSRQTGSLAVSFIFMIFAVISTVIYGWLVLWSAAVGIACVTVSNTCVVMCRSITFSHAIGKNRRNAGGATAGLVCVQFLVVTAALLSVSFSFGLIGVGWSFALAGGLLVVCMVPFAYVIKLESSPLQL